MEALISRYALASILSRSSESYQLVNTRSHGSHHTEETNFFNFDSAIQQSLLEVPGNVQLEYILGQWRLTANLFI